jgi:hypothetical protein
MARALQAAVHCPCGPFDRGRWMTARGHEWADEPPNNPVETEKSNPPSVEKTATPAAPIPLTAKPVHRRRRLLMVVGLVVALLLLLFGIPWLIHSLNTVSTDDAFVNGYVTFVAPRVRSPDRFHRQR